MHPTTTPPPVSLVNVCTPPTLAPSGKPRRALSMSSGCPYPLPPSKPWLVPMCSRFSVARQSQQQCVWCSMVTAGAVEAIAGGVTKAVAVTMEAVAGTNETGVRATKAVIGATEAAAGAKEAAAGAMLQQGGRSRGRGASAKGRAASRAGANSRGCEPFLPQ